MARPCLLWFANAVWFVSFVCWAPSVCQKAEGMSCSDEMFALATRRHRWAIDLRSLNTSECDTHVHIHSWQTHQLVFLLWIYLRSFRPLTHQFLREGLSGLALTADLKFPRLWAHALSCSPALSTYRGQLALALSSDYSGQWELGGGGLLSLAWLIRTMLQVKLHSLQRQTDEHGAVSSLQFLGLGSSGSPAPFLVIYTSPQEQRKEAQPPGLHWHTMHGNETHRVTHCHTHTCSHTPTLSSEAVLAISTEFLSLFCWAPQ